MTKAELVKSLETIPDDFEITVCTVDCNGIDCEIDVNNIEIDKTLKTIYLHLDEDDLYSL